MNSNFRVETVPHSVLHDYIFWITNTILITVFPSFRRSSFIYMNRLKDKQNKHSEAAASELILFVIIHSVMFEKLVNLNC